MNHATLCALGSSSAAPFARIEDHLPLVRRAARSLHHKYRGLIEFDDLLQIGMLALVEAALHYEDRGFAFATYAFTRVRGAMFDELRRRSALTRSATRWHRLVDATRTRLRQRLRREPADSETARAMGVPSAQFRRHADAAHPLRQESLEASYTDCSPAFAAPDPDAEQAISAQHRDATLADAIAHLPEREAMVLRLYFFDELSLDAIGRTLSIGAARVCQIKKTALLRLRGRMAGWEPLDA